MGGKEIDVFPAAGLAKGGDVFDVGTLVELAREQPLIQDHQDPERPVLFDPVEVGDVGEGFPDEGVDGDGDEEMIEDELADYSPLEDVASEPIYFHINVTVISNHRTVFTVHM